jgi:hypothetical protein
MLAGGGTAAALAAGTAQAAPSATTVAASGPTAPPAGAPLTSLVGNGTITQAQASAVQNALFHYMSAHRPTFGPGGTAPALQADGPLATVLGQLVRDRTITPAQATAITDAVQQQVTAHWGTGPGAGGTYGPGMMRGLMWSSPPLREDRPS